MQWAVKGAGGFASKTLNRRIECYVDGVRIKIPSNCRSIVVCNIQSMSDGMFYWGKGPGDKKDVKGTEAPSLGDGKFEFMASKGVQRWLQVKLGGAHYRRLAQVLVVIPSHLRTELSALNTHSGEQYTDCDEIRAPRHGRWRGVDRAGWRD